MFAKFFQPPTLTSTFDNDFLFAANKIVSYEYTKRWSNIGDFSMTLPFSKDFLKSLKVNGTIYFDGDWLWIQNIAYDGQKITLTGKDCKGLLSLRMAIPGDTQAVGADGYDIAKGSTQTCIKHYINNHCIEPVDTARKLPIIWKDGETGLTNESYMARYEYISDIINILCDNAGIGYDVQGNIKGSGFTFQTLKGTDRSMNQDENPRIILSAKWGNIVSQSFEHGVDNFYNTIYGTDSQEYSRLVYRDGTVSGISRRECNVNVSVSISDDWFEKYTLNEVKDNVETHSFEIAVPVSGGVNAAYFLGDTVTVKDDFTGDRYDRVITEVSKSYSQGQRTISLVLGQQKQKPFQKIVNNILNGTIKKG